jgi:hypothetical protein
VGEGVCVFTKKPSHPRRAGRCTLGRCWHACSTLSLCQAESQVRRRGGSGSKQARGRGGAVQGIRHSLGGPRRRQRPAVQRGACQRGQRLQGRRGGGGPNRARVQLPHASAGAQRRRLGHVPCRTHAQGAALQQRMQTATTAPQPQGGTLQYTPPLIGGDNRSAGSGSPGARHGGGGSATGQRSAIAAAR